MLKSNVTAADKTNKILISRKPINIFVLNTRCDVTFLALECKPYAFYHKGH